MKDDRSISLNAAIHTIKDALLSWSDMPEWRENKIVDALEKLPSAQPERKKGKWIEYNATGKKQWMCSECCAEEKNPKVARFCYWCGAYMRGEQDERSD